MGLSGFRARQRLIKFKAFFSEISENTEEARQRLLNCSLSEQKALIYFIKLIFGGRISLTPNCLKLIRRQKQFSQLESMYETSTLNTLKDRKILIRFAKILSILLEVLIL